MTDIAGIQRKLEQILKPERFTHTIGVMYTASSLAMCYKENIEKAMLSGLLHDCGKFCAAREQVQLCEDYGIRLSSSELQMPALIHAKLGAYLASKEYNIVDPDIVSAITYHTTGRPGMTLLEKIVYIADFIEPGRREIPVLQEVRAIAFSDLNRAVLLSAESTISYLERANKPIDPMTTQTCEYYQNCK